MIHFVHVLLMTLEWYTQVSVVLTDRVGVGPLLCVHLVSFLYLSDSQWIALCMYVIGICLCDLLLHVTGIAVCVVFYL